VDMYSVLWSRL